MLRGTVRVLDREAWKDAEELMRTLVERVAATTGAEVDVDYVRGVPPVVNDPRAVALLRAAALETVGTDHLMLSPQSMGGEDFGWFADVMPIALARLGTHGGGPPLDLHRGTFDIDERAIGVGVRLLARTALHALEADAAHGSPAGPTPPARTRRPAPGDTAARRTVDERREPEDEPHRPRRLTPAHADAEVPAEHEVPEDLSLAAEFDAATRDQWRELVAGVLRKAGREELPDPVEEALSRTVATGVRVAPLYTAEDAADLPERGRRPRPRPVRARSPRRSPSGERRPRGLGHPAAARPPGRRRHQGGDRRRPRERRHLAVAGASARARSRSTRSATCCPTCSSTSPR